MNTIPFDWRLAFQVAFTVYICVGLFAFLLSWVGNIISGFWALAAAFFLVLLGIGVWVVR